MGYRELFLILSSTVLFSIIKINVNRNFVESQDVLQEHKIAYQAIGIAKKYFEEAHILKFDSRADDLDPADMPGGFSPWYALGSGRREYYGDFDDIDDFHQFNTVVISNGITFNVSIKVRYVDEANLQSWVWHRTFFKNMIVVVSCDYLKEDITMQQLFSYYGLKN